MTYRVIWTKNAFKSLSKLDKQIAQRIVDRLEFIKDDPIASVKRLQGVEVFSLRVGDHRVILAVDFVKNTIVVNNIGHRSNVYDRL